MEKFLVFFFFWREKRGEGREGRRDGRCEKDKGLPPVVSAAAREGIKEREMG